MEGTNRTFVPGIYDSVDASDYHADVWGGLDLPTFSRSVAVEILQSPLAAWAAHPLLGGMARVEDGEEDETEEARGGSASKDAGAIYHELILGGSSSVVVLPYDSFRRTEAKEARNAALAQGLIPIAEPKWQPIRRVKDRIVESLVREGVNLACDKEVVVLWRESISEVPAAPAHFLSASPDPIPCKARLDILDDDGPKIVISDLKIRERLNVDGFRRTLDRYGLDMQAAVYKRAVESVYPQMAGRVEFQFVLAEQHQPYDVAIIPAGATLLALGEMKWKLALLAWSRCLTSNKWPGTGKVEPAGAQPWQLAETVRRYIEAFGEHALPDLIKVEDE